MSRRVAAAEARDPRVRLRSARPEDAAALARVQVAAARRAYRGVLPDQVLAGFEGGQRAALWHGLFSGPGPPPLVDLVERADGRLAGFSWWRRLDPARCGYGGEVLGLYVRPDLQRRGLGRRLMARTAARLAADGRESCYLWVFEALTAARAFYEALGGRVVDRDWETVAELRIPLVAYAWRPLETLTGQGAGAP